MKPLFCFVILLIQSSLILAQADSPIKNFYLNGTIIGIDTGRITLYFRNDQSEIVRDTSSIVNGTFSFQGNISHSVQCGLKTLYGDNFASIFVDPGEQNMLLTAGNFSHFTMKGSVTQQQADRLQIKLKDVELESGLLKHLYDSLDQVSSKEMDSIIQQSYVTKLDSIKGLLLDLAKKQVKIETEFVLHHPNSYVSLATLRDLFVYYKNVNSEKAQELYNSFSKSLQNSIDGKLIEEELFKQGKNKIGTLIPQVNVSDINNKPFSFSNLSNKYVLIDFWASWCLPCRKAIPHLKNLYQKYHSSGLEIVMISIDEKRSDWKNAVSSESVDAFINVLATTRMKEDFANTQMPIPNQIIVNKKGEIIWNSIYQHPNETLEERLKSEFEEKK